MQLTEEQLELMTKVRDQMAADLDSGRCLDRKFLCHNIVLIENGMEEFTRPGGFGDIGYAEGSLSKDLIESVTIAINHFITLELYLAELKIGLEWSEIMQVYAPLARVAWLDRIVATGEIA